MPVSKWKKGAVRSRYLTPVFRWRIICAGDGVRLEPPQLPIAADDSCIFFVRSMFAAT